MKKITLLLTLLWGSYSLMAEGVYNVGASQPYKTISEAWTAIGTDVLSEYRIVVDEGTYIEGELKGIPNVKITIEGAGADKTIIKRKDVEGFSLLGGEQCGYLFRSTKKDDPLADNMEVICEKMTFQNIGASKTNWGGALVVAEALNQKYTFRNCNFKNIYVRQGALIATTAAAATPVAFTMEDCFVEDCGEYDYNNIAGMMFFRWGATVVLRNTTFMNNSFELHNQHPTSNPGLDFDRKNGLIMHVQAADDYPTDITMENVNIVNSSITAETTSLLPMIRVTAASSASVNSLNLKNVVILDNARSETLDCDFAYGTNIAPSMESCVFNVVNEISEIDNEGTITYTFDNVGSYAGAEIGNDFSYTSASVAFEMEGELPRIYTNEYGAKYLNRIVSGMTENTAADLKVSVKSGVLELSGLNNTDRVLVFDLFGKQIESTVARSGEVNFSLNSGVYVVKVASEVIKVVL